LHNTIAKMINNFTSNNIVDSKTEIDDLVLKINK